MFIFKYFCVGRSVVNLLGADGLLYSVDMFMKLVMLPLQKLGLLQVFCKVTIEKSLKIGLLSLNILETSCRAKRCPVYIVLNLLP